jgi:hypothetical protein
LQTAVTQQREELIGGDKKCDQVNGGKRMLKAEPR